MVIGPFINAGAILFGGVIGALLSQRLARTDSRLNDVYFWPVFSGNWYSAGDEVR
ncbi:Putative inner membrane protein YqgA [Salmonella enterica subsp. salamae]|uniref:Inner membrane protein YqgA n=1 Tax=Salmonella enterica subsp. salamae TaxID=59202 RepID=A0A6D2G5H2_SALER|nr:Putative inner membrane protein YqgA [Salmonella enterica subsp. salamae]